MSEISGSYSTTAGAQAFFSRKVNLPTRRWNDLWQGQHAHAFVVAGATKEALLRDLRSAVDDAVLRGMTYDQFHRQFEQIVARHGWTGWTGEGSKKGRAWRSRVIWQTNVQTAYQAGRYREMTDPATLAHMPWWQYRHNTVLNPREQHVAWNGMVLKHDDPFWRTHWPPNGWGCRCDVRPLSDRQLRKLGKTGPDPSPGADAGGVPPEWAYNVGEAAWGKASAKAIIDASGGGAMRSMEKNGPKAFKRPASVPADRPGASLLPPTSSPADLRAAFERIVGGPARVIADPAGTRVNITSAPIEGGSLSQADVARYLPLLPAMFQSPFEVWVGFARNSATGKVQLRRRYVKAFDLGEGTVELVADVVDGHWIALARVAGESPRLGELIWGRP